MKKLFFLLLNLIALGNILGQGIQFEPENTAWSVLLSKARLENKLIFVVAYSPSCHYCQHMLEKVYPLEAVGNAFNGKYINVKINVDQGEGADIANEYKIFGLPAYVFVNGKGAPLHRAQGSMLPEKLKEIGDNTDNPDWQYVVLKNRFEKGDTSSVLLKRLVSMAKGLEDGEMLEAAHLPYLATQADWLTKDNMDLILSALKSIDQPIFAFVVQHQAEFIKAYSEAKIKKQIDEVVLNSMLLHSYAHEQKDFDLAKAKAYGTPYLPPALLDQSMSLLAVDQCMRKQEIAHFLAAAVKHLDQYPCFDDFLLNNIAQAFYDYTDDKNLLEKALNWSLKAISLEETFQYYDTAAALYFKLDNKTKAKNCAEKAIELANRSGNKAGNALALLKKIEGR